jgi:hypothetical protein
VEFIDSPFFSQLLSRYLAEDEYRRLQLYLALEPAAGDLMPGTAAAANCARRTGGGAR